MPAYPTLKNGNLKKGNELCLSLASFCQAPTYLRSLFRPFSSKGRTS